MLVVRPPLTLTALVAVAMAVLIGLGVWQLNRLDEKSAFLERLKAQSAASPASPPHPSLWSRLNLDAADLTRVRVRGEWLPGATATVRVVMPDAKPGDRTPGGFGRYMIAALRLDDEQVVLVNRGFAPEAAVAGLPAPSGRADLTGFMRKPEAGNAFTPAGDAARRDFHRRDPALIGQALGLSVAPFMIEAERDGTGEPPAGVEAAALIARIPNNHLQYALTWFGLAVTLAGVFAAYLRGVGRKPAGP